MTDLQIMKHAKSYIEKLANGIDPLTDQPAREEDVINNVRVSRCLFYVADVLRQVIDNGGVIKKSPRKEEKVPFSLSFENRSKYPIDEAPTTISIITSRFNEMIDFEKMQKLKTNSILKFLIQNGLLHTVEKPDGGKTNQPTNEGNKLGIKTIPRVGQNGEYIAVVYSREAQQFILDNLDSIIALNSTSIYENSGKPWSEDEDIWLRNAHNIRRLLLGYLLAGIIYAYDLL